MHKQIYEKVAIDYSVLLAQICLKVHTLDSLKDKIIETLRCLCKVLPYLASPETRVTVSQNLYMFCQRFYNNLERPHRTTFTDSSIRVVIQLDLLPALINKTLLCLEAKSLLFLLLQHKILDILCLENNADIQILAKNIRVSTEIGALLNHLRCYLDQDVSLTEKFSRKFLRADFIARLETVRIEIIDLNSRMQQAQGKNQGLSFSTPPSFSTVSTATSPFLSTTSAVPVLPNPIPFTHTAPIPSAPPMQAADLMHNPLLSHSSISPPPSFSSSDHQENLKAADLSSRPPPYAPIPAISLNPMALSFVLIPAVKYTRIEELLNQLKEKGDDVSMGVPQQYIDTIFPQIFTDPVVAADGYVYERKSITEWINKRIGSNFPVTSPITGELLASSQLFPSQNFRAEIILFLQKRLELLTKDSDMLLAINASTAAPIAVLHPQLDLLSDGIVPPPSTVQDQANILLPVASAPSQSTDNLQVTSDLQQRANPFSEASGTQRSDKLASKTLREMPALNSPIYAKPTGTAAEIVAVPAVLRQEVAERKSEEEVCDDNKPREKQLLYR